MAADSEADGIQRDRERRRAAERRRIDGERERRRSELARLEAFSAGHPGPADGSPVVASPVREPSGVASGPAPRPIGAAIRSDALRAFLEVDPTERFDLRSVNLLRLAGLVRDVADDPELLAELSRRASELMARVKQEEDDPLTAGAYLREQVLDWYRHSAADPMWSAGATPRWAGLFADSRISGGQLHPWLNVRLAALRDEATAAGRLTGRLRRGILRSRRSDASVARTPSQQIQAEVVQAVLADLAHRARDPETPLPLVRLSELGVRRQLPTVNGVLALLFGSPENGPFVILHPNRYPECDELVIRPPTPGASGAALAYTLAPGRPGKRGAVRLSLSTDGVAISGAPAEGPSENPEGEVDASTLWESDAVGASTWSRVVEECRRDRRRLEAPPREFRSRPAYASLKELVVSNAEFRKAFLAVKWRGRPTGLPLLVALLQKGRFAPEVSTDHEYLEAELAEWTEENGAPAADGVWTFGEWKVQREAGASGGLSYRAERSAGRGNARS